MLGNQINSTRRAVWVGIIIGSIAVTLFAFQRNLHAQTSPLTVKPSRNLRSLENWNS